MTLSSPPSQQEFIPLAQLSENEQAVVHMPGLEADEREALIAMGLHEEATVKLCQQGQPCIVQVEATRLGLSQEVAARILVRRCAACN